MIVNIKIERRNTICVDVFNNFQEIKMFPNANFNYDSFLFLRESVYAF